MKHIVKKNINLNEINLNIRRSWGKLNPCVRKIESKKIYTRKKFKIEY